jgi:hypothetical protein
VPNQQQQQQQVVLTTEQQQQQVMALLLLQQRLLRLQQAASRQQQQQPLSLHSTEVQAAVVQHLPPQLADALRSGQGTAAFAAAGGQAGSRPLLQRGITPTPQQQAPFIQQLLQHQQQHLQIQGTTPQPPAAAFSWPVLPGPHGGPGVSPQLLTLALQMQQPQPQQGMLRQASASAPAPTDPAAQSRPAAALVPVSAAEGMADAAAPSRRLAAPTQQQQQQQQHRGMNLAQAAAAAAARANAPAASSAGSSQHSVQPMPLSHGQMVLDLTDMHQQPQQSARAAAAAAAAIGSSPPADIKAGSKQAAGSAERKRSRPALSPDEKSFLAQVTEKLRSPSPS